MKTLEFLQRQDSISTPRVQLLLKQWSMGAFLKVRKVLTSMMSISNKTPKITKLNLGLIKMNLTDRIVF